MTCTRNSFQPIEAKFARKFGRNGLSLIEVVLASAIMSLMIVSSLQAVAGMIQGQRLNADRVRADLVAQELIAEIQQLSYLEPSQVSSFGPESGEQTVPSSRTNFDDIDDFHLWIASPPQNRDGSAIAELEGWSRSVEVAHVASSNLDTVLTTNNDQGFKRITVTVARDGVILARKILVKSSEWAEPPYE